MLKKEPLKMLEQIKTIIGILALQGIKVVETIVKSLQFSFLIVFVAITPLTPQPEETKKEITLLPHNPNFKNSLSKIKATLAM